jgi:ribosomal subunit interface protein
MNLAITGRQIDVGDALRAHVERHVDEIASKYFGDPLEAHVTFSHEGPFYRTQIKVRIGKDIALESQSDDANIYESFNQAADHMRKRLRRHKRKLRDHQ